MELQTHTGIRALTRQGHLDVYSNRRDSGVGWFFTRPQILNGCEARQDWFLYIGIDDPFIAGVSRKVRPGTLAVALIAGEAARDRVIGILQGFRAEITRTRLIGDDRKQWMDRLSAN